MKQFKTRKRVITNAEKIAMRQEAIASAQKLRLTNAEKEKLVAEGKLRKVVSHPDSKTTIVRYEPIEVNNNHISQDQVPEPDLP